ncbi:MAG TPA: Uxx-star family glutaredoxin-like (seleno)protein [Candidatus Dormibacteraeota bacterium]|jgi:glutaredoxin
MQPEVVIYSTPTCTYCAAAKRWFKEHGVAYTEFDVTRDPARAAEMQRLTGQNAVPVIRVGGQVMVGFDPLQLARLIPAQPDPADGGAPNPGGRVSLGMAAQSLTPEKAAEVGLPAAFGVVVGPVRPGGAAEAAGILEGDVLIGMGSYTLQDLGQLQRTVSLKQPGDSLPLRVWRNREEIEVTITFPAPAAEASPPEKYPLQA